MSGGVVVEIFDDYKFSKLVSANRCKECCHPRNHQCPSVFSRSSYLGFAPLFALPLTHIIGLTYYTLRNYSGREMFAGLVLLHVLGASTWTGRHLILSLTVLP